MWLPLNIYSGLTWFTNESSLTYQMLPISMLPKEGSSFSFFFLRYMWALTAWLVNASTQASTAYHQFHAKLTQLYIIMYVTNTQLLSCLLAYGWIKQTSLPEFFFGGIAELKPRCLTMLFDVAEQYKPPCPTLSLGYSWTRQTSLLHFCLEVNLIAELHKPPCLTWFGGIVKLYNPPCLLLLWGYS